MGEYHSRAHSRAHSRDRAYRGLAVALIAVIAGMLIAMIAMGAFDRAQIEAAQAATIMAF